MRSQLGVWIATIAIVAGIAAVDKEHNPVRTHPHVVSEAAGPRDLLVKLRSRSNAATGSQRIQALAARARLELHADRALAGPLHAIRVEAVAGAESMASTLARLRADPDVEYAEPDQRRYIHSLPNDALYPQQWYLFPSSPATPSAIDAQTAWATRTGNPALVIADIDTGVRFDHPDLLTYGQGSGRLLPGYCFISDAFVANGNACPGGDASDPGDWVTSADLAHSECASAQVALSSWHGTRTAGLLGAITDNGVGIAGVTWLAQILPVRALGKCGGADSDIIAGMLWAAGLHVEGVPDNATPAKIINMSLGASGACPQSYQDAIDQVRALGVLVVVSAGNEGGPVDAPANCSGVVGVAGLRHTGTKVGYSSLGPEIALGAPAGNCVNVAPGEPCVYSIASTTNLGVEAPGANDYTGPYYCDPSTGGNPNCAIGTNQYRTYNLGTSFSAPLVSGIAGLMVAANANLNSCQLLARLKEGAVPYPQSSVGAATQPPSCHVPAGAKDVQDGECICTLDGRTCGVGMANAVGALTAALRPIAAVSLPSSVAAGQTIQLSAAHSAAAADHTIVSYVWANAGGVGVSIASPNSASTSLVVPSCGIATVRLTVTDDQGRADSADVIISPTSISTMAPQSAGQTTCSLTPPPVQVAVCPATAAVLAGSGSQAFAATLANASSEAVSWQVNGIPGGSSNVGTISSSGVYTAPSSVPSPATVTVAAVSDADSTATATAQVTVTTPPSGGGGALGGGALSLLAALAWARRPAHRTGSQP